ncbi:hypothetical protein NM208_g8300 [Fusarium decemcellulare]|uniref:Uncharacterized protein n=2 Tax=Fusarium decemcellulare TaxID=57161 RepID=A0ACC1S5U0_9HYPO|nr:hypothetical protein NM208_g8482 [Fusarium decemcellulare]KAJ3532734.1 hypothetical protein NM208_g8300 [Fusarium decemcellulare]
MSKEIAEFCDTMSMASTVDGCLTPTHTDMTVTDDNATHVESVPSPDGVFIIRHRDTGRVITLIDGELRLCEGFSARGGFHWQCVEKDRWLGFRNCVSGTFIGHNDRKKFIAKATHHRTYEYFTPRPHPQGGYELLIRHGDELWSMTVGAEGTTLIETKGEGALWDFLRT